MSVSKSFGFASGSPYTSSTFNRNNSYIFSTNGPLTVGNVSQQSDDVVVSDVVFIQEGVIVQKIGTVIVTVPTNLVAPYYLTATIPDSNPVDNIVWGFVKRPQDITPETVLIAEWDGQEWSARPELSVGGMVAYRQKASKAYDHLGFNYGLQFYSRDNFSTYSLTDGAVTDSAGQLNIKMLDHHFTPIPADNDFTRIDAIIYRRETDHKYRIGHFLLKSFPGYLPDGPGSVSESVVDGGAEVKQNVKTLETSNGQQVVLFRKTVGGNEELHFSLYNSDKKTVAVLPTSILADSGDYDAIMYPGISGDEIAIVSTIGTTLFYKAIDLTGSDVVPIKTLDSFSNPVSSPSLYLDFLNRVHVSYIYQVGPSTHTPYYTRVTIAGDTDVPSRNLLNTADRYLKCPIVVTKDLLVHVAYTNSTRGRVEYEILDDVGTSVLPRAVISDDVEKDGLLKPPGDSRNGNIVASESGDVFVTFETQKTSGGVYGLAIYHKSYKDSKGFTSALVPADAAENVTAHVVDVDWKSRLYFIYEDGSDAQLYRIDGISFAKIHPSPDIVFSGTSSYYDIGLSALGSMPIAYINGDEVRLNKYVVENPYSFSHLIETALDSDYYAALIERPSNTVYRWSDEPGTQVEDIDARQDWFLHCDGDISWKRYQDDGTLEWTSDLEVNDPFRGYYTMPAEAISPMAELDVLYFDIPSPQDLVADGDTDGPNTIRVQNDSDYQIGNKVFVGDSVNVGMIADVTGKPSPGVIQLSQSASAYATGNGAYVYRSTVQWKLTQQNDSILRPTASGYVTDRIFIVAWRKDHLIHFRDGYLTLEHGETGQIGDGVSTNVLDYMGSESESDSSPDYTLSDDTEYDNVFVEDGDNLTKGIKTLDARPDTVPRVRAIDLVSTALPSGNTIIIDGTGINLNDEVLFTLVVDPGVYMLTDATAGTWTKRLVFGGTDIIQEGSQVRVLNGTVYYRTIWEYRAAKWSLLQGTETTGDNTGHDSNNIANTEITFDDAARTVTLSPKAPSTHFDYFIKGAGYRKDSPQTVTLPNVTALYYIYFDGPDLVFSVANTAPKGSYALVCFASYNTDTSSFVVVGDTRHLNRMSQDTQRMFHNTQGVVHVTGLSAENWYDTGDGTADADAQIGLSDGDLLNIDLLYEIRHSLTPTNPFEQHLSPFIKAPILARVGTNGDFQRIPATDFIVQLQTNRIGWNTDTVSGTWAIEEVSADNMFASAWIVGTGDVSEPILVIMGTGEYTTLSEAQEKEEFYKLGFSSFFHKEVRSLYRVIFETAASFTNPVRAAIRDVSDQRLSQSTTLPGGANDHGLLSGLDDPDHGPTAVRTTGIPLDGLFTPSDIDVRQSLTTLNHLLGLMRLREHTTNPKRLVITGANRLLNSGVEAIQSLKNLFLKFDGAEIDPVAGKVYESDGVTDLGLDFEPLTVGTNEFKRYSVTLLPSDTGPLGEIMAQVLVLPGANSDVDLVNAPYPPFGKGVHIGQFWVQEQVGGIVDMDYNNVQQMGAIGGSGGSGTGDANTDQNIYLNRLNLSTFGLATMNIAAIDEDEHIDDTSTAVYSIADEAFKFEKIVSAVLLSTDLLDPAEHENITRPLDAVELYAIWKPDFVDETAQFEVTRDGFHFQIVNMEQVGDTGYFRGWHNFTDEPVSVFAAEYPVTSANTTTTLQDSGVVSVAQPFALTSLTTLTTITAYANKANANTVGLVSVQIIKDDGGQPSGLAEDVAYSTPWAVIDDMSTGNVEVIFSNQSCTLTPGDYHLVFTTDSTYKGSYGAAPANSFSIRGASSGPSPNQLNSDGSTWSSAAPRKLCYLLQGREISLKVKITSLATLEDRMLQSYCLFHKLDAGGGADEDFAPELPYQRQLFTFDGIADNLNEFNLAFSPDPAFLTAYARDAGQTYRYGDFTTNGSTIIFPPDTFKTPGQITLEFFQPGGGGGRSSAPSLEIIRENHLGHPGNPALDYSLPGRGIILRTPDGTPVELSVEDNLSIKVRTI